MQIHGNSITRELVPMEKLPTSEARLKRSKQLFGNSCTAVVAAIGAATASIAATLGAYARPMAKAMRTEAAARSTFPVFAACAQRNSTRSRHHDPHSAGHPSTRAILATGRAPPSSQVTGDSPPELPVCVCENREKLQLIHSKLPDDATCSQPPSHIIIAQDKCQDSFAQLVAENSERAGWHAAECRQPPHVSAPLEQEALHSAS